MITIYLLLASPGDQCVPKSFHCDGERDCQDNSDEVCNDDHDPDHNHQAGCRPPEIVVSPPPTITVDQSFTFIINCTAVGVPTPQVRRRTMMWIK